MKRQGRSGNSAPSEEDAFPYDLHFDVKAPVCPVLYENVKAYTFCKKVDAESLFRLDKTYAFNLKVQKHFKEFLAEV